MTQDKGVASDEARATHEPDPAVPALRVGIANAALDYEDQPYVQGVRDLANIIKDQKTANWVAVAAVLQDCADLMEHYARAAQAIEARSGETGTGSTEGESAVPERNLPND